MEANQNRTLGRDDWFLAGLEMLADGGPPLLRAAKLARILGVTTGSFYWHFRSVADFQTELLEYWKEDVVGACVAEILMKTGLTEEEARDWVNLVAAVCLTPWTSTWNPRASTAGMPAFSRSRRSVRSALFDGLDHGRPRGPTGDP